MAEQLKMVQQNKTMTHRILDLVHRSLSLSHTHIFTLALTTSWSFLLVLLKSYLQCTIWPLNYNTRSTSNLPMNICDVCYTSIHSLSFEYCKSRPFEMFVLYRNLFCKPSKLQQKYIISLCFLITTLVINYDRITQVKYLARIQQLEIWNIWNIVSKQIKLFFFFLSWEATILASAYGDVHGKSSCLWYDHAEYTIRYLLIIKSLGSYI